MSTGSNSRDKSTPSRSATKSKSKNINGSSKKIPELQNTEGWRLGTPKSSRRQIKTPSKFNDDEFESPKVNIAPSRKSSGSVKSSNVKAASHKKKPVSAKFPLVAPSSKVDQKTINKKLKASGSLSHKAKVSLQNTASKSLAKAKSTLQAAPNSPAKKSAVVKNKVIIVPLAKSVVLKNSKLLRNQPSVCVEKLSGQTIVSRVLGQAIIPKKSVNTVSGGVKDRSKEPVKVQSKELVKTASKESQIKTAAKEPSKVQQKEPSEVISKEPGKVHQKEPIKPVLKDTVSTSPRVPLKAVTKEQVKTVSKEPVKVQQKEPVPKNTVITSPRLPLTVVPKEQVKTPTALTKISPKAPLKETVKSVSKGTLKVSVGKKKQDSPESVKSGLKTLKSVLMSVPPKSKPTVTMKDANGDKDSKSPSRVNLEGSSMMSEESMDYQSEAEAPSLGRDKLYPCPVNENNVQRVLDKSVSATATMRQLLCSFKDDLKRMGGGVSSTASIDELLIKPSHMKRRMEVAAQLVDAFIQYMETLDSIVDTSTLPPLDFSEGAWSITDLSLISDKKKSSPGSTATKRPMKQATQASPAKKQKVSTPAVSKVKKPTAIITYDSSPVPSPPSHPMPKPVKKPRIRDEPEAVSNDLWMSCEAGSDDENLYNVGFPKYNRAK